MELIQLKEKKKKIINKLAPSVEEKVKRIKAADNDDDIMQFATSR